VLIQGQGIALDLGLVALSGLDTCYAMLPQTVALGKRDASPIYALTGLLRILMLIFCGLGNPDLEASGIMEE
jgi:hypothetical protein